jgi:hypothetical protein
MYRYNHYAYPINNAESIVPVLRLLQEQVVNDFSHQYSGDCPAVRIYPPSTLVFPPLFFDAVKNRFPQRMRPTISLSVHESEEELGLMCKSYLTMWPVTNYDRTQSLFKFELGF